MKHLDTDELRILHMIGHIPCLPEKILTQLNIIANQIKELVMNVQNKKIDAIIAASYVHQELITVYPFMHGNKRTARIWMNIMLQMGGHKAIVIPNDDYSIEIIKDRKSPGSFVTYLEKVIRWNREQTFQ